MNPFFYTDFSIPDSLKTVLKSVLIYDTIIGEISEHGNHSKLMSIKGVYCDLFEMQADAYNMSNDESA